MHIKLVFYSNDIQERVQEQNPMSITIFHVVQELIHVLGLEAPGSYLLGHSYLLAVLDRQDRFTGAPFSVEC